MKAPRSSCGSSCSSRKRSATPRSRNIRIESPLRITHEHFSANNNSIACVFCSFVMFVHVASPSAPRLSGNGCFHDAKIICPDLLSVTPITVHATIFTVRPPRPVPACSCVPVIPASLFYSPLVRWAVAGFPAAGSADVSFCFDLFRCEIRKKDGNCGIRASFRLETGAESPRLCRFRPSRIYITFCTVYL